MKRVLPISLFLLLRILTFEFWVQVRGDVGHAPMGGFNFTASNTSFSYEHISTNGTVADPVKLINIYEILCPTCDPHQCTPVDCYNWLMTDKCRESFEKILDKYDNRERCTWDKIKSSYTNFTECTELYAEILMIPWPNQLVEDTFVQIHASYFQDCRVTELFDPPPSVIFVLVMTPICLIPVMVTLVVLKTKNGDGTS